MEADLPSSLHSAVIYKTAIAAAFFVALFVAERVFSAAQYPRDRSRLFRNVGLWAIIVIASPLIVAPITGLGANTVLWSRPDVMRSGLMILLLDIVLLDMWTYWMHRAWHRVPIMWRFHSVHHMDEFLDTTSAYRFHIGEVVVSALFRLAPIMLFAIPFVHVVIFEAMLVCVALFHHSNLKLPARLERMLSYLIVTPSIHWMHHHVTPMDTDSNYAGILSIWDRIFRTKSMNSRTPDMKIGLETVEDQSFLQLLLRPISRIER